MIDVDPILGSVEENMVKPKARAIKHTRATISDIARHCNLSKTTVSRILSNAIDRFPIRPATIQRVRQAADELGYSPNRLARAIACNRTHLIGLYIPARRVALSFGEEPISVVTSISHMLISGILSLPEFKDYDLLIHKFDEIPMSSQADSGSKQELLDGLIFIDPAGQAGPFLERAAKKMPVVALASYQNSDVEFQAIDIDNYGLAKKATEHLFRVAGPNLLFCQNSSQSELRCMNLRGAGFRDAMIELGASSENQTEFAFDMVDGRISASSLEAVLKSTGARGIFANDDEMAVAIVDAAHSLEIKIPDQLAVIGFGGVSSITRDVRPILSTVEVPFFSLARRAAKIILSVLDDNEPYVTGTSLISGGKILEQESTRIRIVGD
jgi:LacI family transcriptional regulator